jgi:hypothetical protein
MCRGQGVQCPMLVLLWEPFTKAGTDGNHGFLLRRAVRIRQSAWGVAPRHSTHRAVSLTILAVIKLTPSRCGSRGSIATDVKKLVGHRAAIVRVALGV